jgi:adenylate kinase
MRLILLGAPGSGKGTQAKLLCERNHLEHISTGDILREAIRRETPVGVRAQPYVHSGQLVPDEVVNDLIAERFGREDRPTSFVLDGYPRTLIQAVALDKTLQRYGLNLTAAVLLRVEDEEIVRRVSGRWSCPKPGCGASYQLTSHPPKRPGLCDLDGTPLIQRKDDQPETVRGRLRIFRKEVLELAPYYRAQCLLREVQGLGSPEDVYANIMQAVSLQAGSAC